MTKFLLIFLMACPAFANFPKGNITKTTTLLSDVTATGAGTGYTPYNIARTYHAFGETSAGAGSATILIEVSNVATPGTNDWGLLATISQTLSTTTTNDITSSVVPWLWVRARVSAISGTGANVSVVMGQ